jgi:hypothetical protein
MAGTMLRSRNAPVYSVTGAVAGRPNLRYSDRSGNDMLFATGRRILHHAIVFIARVGSFDQLDHMECL